MHLATMAEVELYRVGSASSGGFLFGGHKAALRRRLIDDTSLESLRRLVIELAVEEGEGRPGLSGLRQVEGWRYSSAPGVIMFDVFQQNVQYGSAYAACCTFPVLESEGRYFKLDEIKV